MINILKLFIYICYTIHLVTNTLSTYIKMRKLQERLMILVIIICCALTSRADHQLLSHQHCMYNDSLADYVTANLNILPAGFKRIVIDPGHGGKDHGCSSSTVLEKDIALELSKTLGAILQEKFPTLQIIYTREKDEFVTLNKRIEIANNLDADLFISIHCNYVKEAYVSGTETYVLGAGEHVSHQSHEKHSRINQNEFKEILYQKLENNAYVKSLDLADKIENSFSTIRGYRSRGVRKAGFSVLRKTRMPAVLIEAGFLSNKNDKALLNTSSGRKKIATKIYEACNYYIHSLNKGDYELHIPEVVKYHPIIVQPIYAVDSLSLPVPQKIFSIQIAEYKHIPKINSKGKWGSLKDVNIIRKDDTYKFIVGTYDNIQDAIDRKEELIDKGFAGAFVIQK